MLRIAQPRPLAPKSPPTDVSRLVDQDRQIERGPVLLIDDHEAFSTNLGRGFSDIGFTVWLERDFTSARIVAETQSPRLIIMELKVAGEWALDQVETFRAICPDCRLVIATVYPAVATAVRATRLGVNAYLVKPVTPDLVLSVLQDSDSSVGKTDPRWPSLDRTIWEYLNQMFVTAGSMSEAARRLGLDRRSLRRMLSKYPPAR